MPAMSIKEFCKQRYLKHFNSTYATIAEDKMSRGAKSLSAAAEISAIREAQKAAIRNSLKEAVDEYASPENVALIWQSVYNAHLMHRIGEIPPTGLNEDIVEIIISASQSWKKSSGHAFEAFIAENVSAQLNAGSEPIRFLLQKEVTELIRDGELHNPANDLEWIRQKIDKDVFDLFAIVEFNHKNFLFGCIQAKTSIRDRVSRDREPSIDAMDNHFWSIAVVLDGTYLAMPKFIEMVNGGGNDYVKNGWHGMYVMSDTDSFGRIYGSDYKLDLLTTHASKAAQFWMSGRPWIDAGWSIEKLQ